jgi:hypothetical protein
MCITTDMRQIIFFNQPEKENTQMTNQILGDLISRIPFP